MSLALALALALQAPPPSELSCVADRLSPAERRAIAAQADSGTAPFIAALRECTRRHGWDRRREDYARDHALATITRAEVQPDLERAGVPTAAIDARIAARPDSAMTASETSSAPFVMELITAAGVPRTAIRSDGRAIGAYIAATVLLDRLRRGLAPD